MDASTVSPVRTAELRAIVNKNSGDWGCRFTRSNSQSPAKAGAETMSISGVNHRTHSLRVWDQGAWFFVLWWLCQFG